MRGILSSLDSRRPVAAVSGPVRRKEEEVHAERCSLGEGRASECTHRSIRKNRQFPGWEVGRELEQCEADVGAALVAGPNPVALPRSVLEPMLARRRPTVRPGLLKGRLVQFALHCRECSGGYHDVGRPESGPLLPVGSWPLRGAGGVEGDRTLPTAKQRAHIGHQSSRRASASASASSPGLAGWPPARRVNPIGSSPGSFVWCRPRRRLRAGRPAM